MLVIRRREGESIVVSGGVEVQVLEISPTRVKLGITAPGEITVLRKESLLAQSQNREASGPLPVSRLAGWAASLRGAARRVSEAGGSGEA